MSTKDQKPAAEKAAKKKPAAKAASPDKVKPAPAEAAAPAPEEKKFHCTVINPEGTKFRSMILGFGWQGALPKSDANALAEIGHVRIDGVAL